MSSLYRPNFKGTDITRSNCKDITKWSFESLLELTGIQGIAPVHKIIPIFFYGTYPALRITIKYSGVVLDRTIYFDTGTIYNEFFKTEQPRQRIGYHVLSAQVKKASSTGFLLLECEALGNAKEGHQYCGYIVWGKLGYLMTQKYKALFDDLMSRHGRTHSTLNDLFVLGDDEFWAQHGSSWEGYFDLQDGSISRNILEDYKNVRGL